MGSNLDTNTNPDGIWYASREDVMGALDVKETTRNRRYIDQALESASRSVDGLCHRRFFPVQATRYFDWPARLSGGYTPWVLRLDDSELISVDTLSSGGRVITSDEYNLEPNRSGPPYSRVEIKLSTNAAYGGGSTYQRDVTITGLWGYRLTEATVGALAASTDSTQTTINIDGPTSAAIGVGSVLRLDSERVIVSNRKQLATGQTGTLGGSKSDVSLPVLNGAAYSVDEVLLLDSERIRIDDIAGNTLTVERAYDGTVLAAHTTAAIYAPRTLVVTRGALGTLAAAHANAAPVIEWRPPGLIRELTKAEAITQLTQERAGWFLKAATTGQSAGKVSADALKTLRDQTYTEHGRTARTRAV